MARIAKSLDVLRSQINATWPKRDKSSDGWIGDARHQAEKSDHNPNAAGVVQAFDTTNDPKNGPDAGKLAEQLIASRDPRIKYVISNRRIAASYATGGAMPWAWRPYAGANAHDHHNHLSVKDDPKLYDNPAPWKLEGGVAPVPIIQPSASEGDRERMGKLIIGYEARRDARGRLAMYTATDGSREIAGVNETYHADKFKDLLKLLDAGKYEEAEKSAADYFMQYSNAAANWTPDPACEFFLRDCIVNRGPKGAALILQSALGFSGKDRDGAVGPATKAAASKLACADLLENLRKAREAYELEVYGHRPNLWAGMVNRWNKALADAKTFLPSSSVPPKANIVGLATVAVGGAGAGAVAATGTGADSGWDWIIIGSIIFGTLIFGVVVLSMLRSRRA